VPQDQLLEYVWGKDYAGEGHLLQVNMSRLRSKLESDPAHPRYILTKPGIGSMLANPVDRQAAIGKYNLVISQAVLEHD
jgi:DNA-binding response OmpR family regulator